MRHASIAAIDAVELMELLDFIAEICEHSANANLCTILCASSGAGYDADEIAQDCRRLRDAIVVEAS
jgi:hypothetical protein